jgi:hypothetical protein
MNWEDIGVQAIVALTPVLTFLIVWLLKMAWSKIPASIVLFAAPAVGVLVNFVLSYISGHPPSSLLLAALLGVLATSLREWLTTFQSKGLTGSVSETPRML